MYNLCGKGKTSFGVQTSKTFGELVAESKCAGLISPNHLLSLVFRIPKMLIAQTSLNSFPLLEIQTEVSPNNYGMWWLLLLAFALSGFVWFVRRQLRRSVQKSSSKDVHKTKGPNNNANNASPSVGVEFSASRIGRDANPRNIGKKKKKDRIRSERNSKASESIQHVAGEAKKASLADLAPTSIALNFSPVAKPSQASIASNAIFEPLREVVQQRRKSTFSTSIASSQSNEAVVSNQPSGGKFERTVAPSAASRMVANRWPAPAEQKGKMAEIASSQPQALLPPSPITNPVPVQVQAKGLQSFVSKVKSSVSTNTDPAT